MRWFVRTGAWVDYIKDHNEWLYNPHNTGGAPLISESSISEGSVHPFFVRQADAGRPKYGPEHIPARQRADEAWGMSPMANYSPMEDMSDDERDYEIGDQGLPKDHNSPTKQSKTFPKLEVPSVWDGGPVSGMTPEQLAQYREYQGQVANYVRRYNETRPASHRNVVEHFRGASPEEVQEGMDWYQKANIVAQQIAKDTGISTNQAAGLLANYSPQTDWFNNIIRASTAARLGKGIGGPGSGVMASRAQARAADRILAGEDYNQVLSGRKVRNFGTLIEHGTDPDPGNPLVVIDRHATGVPHGDYANDFIYGAPGGPTTKGGYDQYTGYYNQAAHSLNRAGVKISPHQLQATTWLVRQRRNGEGGYVTPEQAQGSIARANTARQQLAEYAKQYHPGLLEAGIVPEVGFGGLDKDKANMEEQKIASKPSFFVRTAGPDDEYLGDSSRMPQDPFTTQPPPDPFAPTRNQRGYYDDHFSVIHEPTGAEIYPGSEIKDFRGDPGIYHGLSRVPEYGGSGGKIVYRNPGADPNDHGWGSEREVYPSVFNLKLVPRTPGSDPRQQTTSSIHPYFVRRQA